MHAELWVIKGLREGNERAYKYLFDHYYGLLCKFAYEYMRDASLAEMVVSDVFFAIWKNHSQLTINQSLRQYLLRSVHNGCLNYLNRQSRMVNIQELEDFGSESLSCTENIALETLIEKEIDVRINICLQSLPDLTYKIFCLSRFEELTYNEISTRLNVSVDVVKYHIKSALSRLRDGLKDFLILLFLFFL